MLVATSAALTATRVTGTFGEAMSAAAATARGANICFFASFTARTSASRPWAARAATLGPVPVTEPSPPPPATATCQSRRISRSVSSRPR